MKILVIRISAMGDVAMLAAVLREAATCYPANDYTLLSAQKMKALLADMPPNVHFLAYPTRIDWRLYNQVIDAHSVWRSWQLDLAAWLHSIPVRRIRKPRWSRWCLVHRHRGIVPPMITLYRKLLQIEDIDNPKILTHETRAHIGVAPFAAHAGKIYPLEQMEQVVGALGRYMQERGEKVLLFGAGEQEIHLLRQWSARYEGVESIAGTRSLQEELTLMTNLRIMVTMDSSNMHLASLVGTRVISIWGATHPNAGFMGYRQDPNDCIQLQLPCRPCSIYGKQSCPSGTYACLHIPPSIIIQYLLTNI